MNILFVSMVPFESNSSAVIQNKGIIKGLVELGNEVDVMTLRPNSNALSYDESINDIEEIVRNSYYIEPNYKYTALMMKKESEVLKTSSNNTFNDMLLKCRKLIRNLVKSIHDKIAIFDAQKSNVNQVLDLKLDYSIYDIILSASDPKSSHLIVEKILMKNSSIKAKWIQYWGDPMFNDITRKKDWRDSIVKYMEKKLLKEADKIVYASPLTLKIQKDTYPYFAEKMDYANQVSINIISTDNKPRSQGLNKIHFGYFGTYYSKYRNIICLYDAALHSEYNLNICGPSDLKLESTNNIKVYGMVPYKEATKMEENSDILVTICNSSGTQIPGKIYYCSGYNKPIIVILDGEHKDELKSYFETFNRYILCDNDSDSILKAFEKAINELQINERIINKQLTSKYMASKILLGLGLEYID